MRILGIDYGDARIGLSLSDENEMIAGALATYRSQSMRKDVDYIAALCQEKDVQKIVIGLPLNMDGSSGERAQKTQAFGRVLNRVTGLSVFYRDERLTSVFAERSLKEQGANRQKQKQAVDSVAAQVILQSYLDAQRFQKEMN